MSLQIFAFSSNEYSVGQASILSSWKLSVGASGKLPSLVTPKDLKVSALLSGSFQNLTFCLQLSLRPGKPGAVADANEPSLKKRWMLQVMMGDVFKGGQVCIPSACP